MRDRFLDGMHRRDGGPVTAVERDLEEIELLTRATDLCRPMVADLSNSDKPVAEYTDAETLGMAFALLAVESIDARKWPPHGQRCGWCVGAAGDDQAAWESATVHPWDEIRAHTLACEHNPASRDRSSELAAALGPLHSAKTWPDLILEARRVAEELHEVHQAIEGGLGVMTATPAATIRSHGVRMMRKIDQLEEALGIDDDSTEALVAEVMRLRSIAATSIERPDGEREAAIRYARAMATALADSLPHIPGGTDEIRRQRQGEVVAIALRESFLAGGDAHRARIIALDREIDEMSSEGMRRHVEYKQRRNEPCLSG